ncbi:MAG: ribonuclease Y [Chloroflexi bacterium]|jgi:ribonucrease Y|nr:ribonuclease Y [Chloroflexota bacterium]MBT4072902.1 ribonuclease Y [Chloroflexota bacterium]MBT4514983.1 ribonuclease Y [Chloroflexota bacterium]MBT6681837.1 ribonuclease Y [Chloroflexota bacterium]
MDLALTAVITALLVGVIAGFLIYLRSALTSRRQQAAREAAEQQIRRADARSKEILLEAKEEGIKTRTAAEADVRAERQEIQRHERRVEQREESLEKRSGALDETNRGLERLQTQLETERTEFEELRKTETARIEEISQRETERLEEISGLSANDARQMQMSRAEEAIQFDLARRYRDAEAEAREHAEGQARNILAGAIQRLASDVVSDSSVSSVPLPNDDMKGRLIGREGRNIRAIEAATGVDLIIDETPEAVTISCFDPIRREVARIALGTLIQDGRIHPARVEEQVAKARLEVDAVVQKAGEEAVFEANVKGLHPELVKIVGRLKFRYSYGENVLRHSVEVGLLAGMIAAEIGANVERARVAGFLHDIGKALTHEVEGPHAEIGADLVLKYNVSDQIADPIRQHHDSEMTTPEAFIVAAADAISAARPGARRDTLERYVQRMQELEDAARGFEGVERCFAIQAGREVRVMVQPDVVDDAACAVLARDITNRIESTLSYPGQIKVVVIRESRSVEVAR